MNKVNNVQAAILTECAEERVPVTVFLMNGFQFRGVITNFDPEVVTVAVEGRQQMVYKHAISTIVPGKALKAFSA